MLKKLKLTNFRGIKDGQIENLGQINIFIGKNNSGKSTILESMLFIRASSNLFDELERNVIHQLLERRVKRKKEESYGPIEYCLATCRSPSGRTSSNKS